MGELGVDYLLLHEDSTQSFSSADSPNINIFYIPTPFKYSLLYIHLIEIEKLDALYKNSVHNKMKQRLPKTCI